MGIQMKLQLFFFFNLPCVIVTFSYIYVVVVVGCSLKVQYTIKTSVLYRTLFKFISARQEKKANVAVYNCTATGTLQQKQNACKNMVYHFPINRVRTKETRKLNRERKSNVVWD